MAMAMGGVAEGDERMYLRDAVVLGVPGGQLDGAADVGGGCGGPRRSAAGARGGRAGQRSDGSERPLRLRVRLSSSLLGKGFDRHEAQPVAGGLVAVDDPTECKLAYLAVVSHPAGETVAYLIEKFLQRRFAQRLWFAWLRCRLHLGYVVAKLPGSVPPHPFRGSHRLWVLRVTSLAHVRNVAHSSSSSRSLATRTHCSASRSKRRRAAPATGSPSPRNWPGALTPNSDHHRWKALLKAAGRDARLHDARHTGATIPLVLRVRQRTVMGIMGWSSTAMAGPVSACESPRALLGTVGFTSMPLHRLRSGAYVAVPTRRCCGSRSRWVAQRVGS
jgi:hypothetical protein